MEDTKREDAEKMEDVRNPARGLELPGHPICNSGPHPQSVHADEIELMVPDDADK